MIDNNNLQLTGQFSGPKKQKSCCKITGYQKKLRVHDDFQEMMQPESPPGPIQIHRHASH
jgi:hypothetical protein